MFDKKTIKDVLTLALPAVGEMILYMMIWVFDTMMVGKYGGTTAVSTVGLSSEFMYTFSNIFIAVGVSVGITSLVARKVGAKDYKGAEEYATLGFAFGSIIALILAITAFTFCGNILTLAKAPAEVVNYGTIFMRITSFGIFFSMLMNLFNANLRGHGNTKTPLIVSALVNVINLGLDYLLIFGHFGFPELGIKGSAIATATAQTCGFLFILIYVLRNEKYRIKLKYIINLRGNRLIELMNLSIPSSFQEAAFSLSRLLSTLMIMQIGTIAFSANQITTTIESVSFMPGWGFAVAATTLVGHKIGEKNYKKAKEYAYTCALLGTIIMCICGLFFLLIPKLLIASFIIGSEAQAIKLGALCLMVASIEQPFMAISMILGGALKGAGNTKTPFLVSLFSSWFIRLPLMFYFIYILKTSVVNVWWITTIQWSIDGTLIFIFFRKRFKKICTI